MNEDAKKIMEDGWKARENLEFDKAEELLSKALKIFETNEDWFNVTECLNHLAYTEKLRSVHHNLKGMDYAKKAEAVSIEHNTKKLLVLRALMSLANSAGLFEQALKWVNESLALQTKPLPQADLLSHKATFQLRTGKLLDAELTINEAEKLMESHIDEEQEPHRSIWKSKILATKGLILYNNNKTDEAKKYLKEALKIAKAQNLKTRISEINALVEIFN